MGFVPSLSPSAQRGPRGARELQAIVAVGDDRRGVLAPCGRECQVLLDYHPGIRVIIPIDDGLVSIGVNELLPFAYKGAAVTYRSFQVGEVEMTMEARP